jgi:hypothetical protein
MSFTKQRHSWSCYPTALALHLVMDMSDVMLEFCSSVDGSPHPTFVS